MIPQTLPINFVVDKCLQSKLGVKKYRYVENEVSGSSPKIKK